MNAIQILASQPWVERLGWTLLHFLWQGLTVAALYAAARKVVARPNGRYLLACAALALMVAAPVATWILLRPAYGPVDSAYQVKYALATPSAAAAEFRLPADLAVPDGGRFLPWVVAIWLTGALAFWIRLAGGWVVSARMRSMLVRPAPEQWQQTMRRLGLRIGVHRRVRLLISALVQVPTVVGWLRPVVLVPAGALAGLPAEHLEALLVHELAHIRRHDYLVNLLQSVAEALLFYHPAVWWVSGHLRNERELCCDDVAVSVTGDALTYARALLEWEQCRPAPLAVAANGGSLAGRIARLLGQARPASGTAMGPGVLTVGILLLAAAYGMLAQSTERLAFQVASVKRNTTTSQSRGVRAQPGGRLVTDNAPLKLLILNAYQVQPFQIIGGPEWIDTDGYDIEAKPEAAVDRKQTWLMLQTLLADRFKLALHRETKELPVFALVAGKDGLKQPAKGSGCPSDLPDPNGPSQPVPGASLPCGHVVVSMSPEGLKLMGGKVSMAEFVRILAMVMGRPVLDRTGIAKYIDVQVDFTPDDESLGLPGAGGPGDPGGPRMVNDSSKPGILTAVQEQLGLKLTTTKGPVEVLVIDHVQRPTEN